MSCELHRFLHMNIRTNQEVYIHSQILNDDRTNQEVYIYSPILIDDFNFYISISYISRVGVGGTS